jgi:hypothetical protein
MNVSSPIDPYFTKSFSGFADRAFNDISSLLDPSKGLDKLVGGITSQLTDSFSTDFNKLPKDYNGNPTTNTPPLVSSLSDVQDSREIENGAIPALKSQIGYLSQFFRAIVSGDASFIAGLIKEKFPQLANLGNQLLNIGKQVINTIQTRYPQIIDRIKQEINRAETRIKGYETDVEIKKQLATDQDSKIKSIIQGFSGGAGQ